MPWKECHVEDERLRFVARLREGEKMTPLCAEFGISRKTADKIFDRYKDCGVRAFSDRSRRPHRQANRLPEAVEAVIVRLKHEYPNWGAPKIREKLRRQVTGPHLPAISTVHAVLDRRGLVTRRRRRRSAATGTDLSHPRLIAQPCRQVNRRCPLPVPARVPDGKLVQLESDRRGPRRRAPTNRR